MDGIEIYRNIDIARKVTKIAHIVLAILCGVGGMVLFLVSHGNGGLIGAGFGVMFGGPLVFVLNWILIRPIFGLLFDVHKCASRQDELVNLLKPQTEDEQKDFQGIDASTVYHETENQRSPKSEKLDLDEPDAANGGSRDWTEEDSAALAVRKDGESK